jgi:hypothetical protein
MAISGVEYTPPDANRKAHIWECSIRDGTNNLFNENYHPLWFTWHNKTGDDVRYYQRHYECHECEEYNHQPNDGWVDVVRLSYSAANPENFLVRSRKVKFFHLAIP